MHKAVKANVWLVLTNKAEPPCQAGAFGAAKLKTLSYFLDREPVDHCIDATYLRRTTTSQKGGWLPLFGGITSAITNAIRLDDCGTVPCSVGHFLLSAGGLLCVILPIKAWFDRKESHAVEEEC
jgi:hypothetical protein